jgi:hypothetical protein
MAAAAANLRQGRYVAIDIDDAARLIRVTITGSAAGPEVGTALTDMFFSAPKLTGYDMIYDLRTYSGDVTADDVKPLVIAYQTVRVPEADGTKTAFVTSDPNFAFWAEAFSYQFPGREHRVFEELEPALGWLHRS